MRFTRPGARTAKSRASAPARARTTPASRAARSISVLSHPSDACIASPLPARPFRPEPFARLLKIFRSAYVAPKSAHLDSADDASVRDHLRDGARQFELAARRRFELCNVIENHRSGRKQARV